MDPVLAALLEAVPGAAQLYHTSTTFYTTMNKMVPAWKNLVKASMIAATVEDERLREEVKRRSLEIIDPTDNTTKEK